MHMDVCPHAHAGTSTEKYGAWFTRKIDCLNFQEWSSYESGSADRKLGICMSGDGCIRSVSENGATPVETTTIPECAAGMPDGPVAKKQKTELETPKAAKWEWQVLLTWQLFQMAVIRKKN